MSRVRYAGQRQAALDILPPFRRKPLSYMRERGPSERALPWVKQRTLRGELTQG